jgi:hypothetical protein
VKGNQRPRRLRVQGCDTPLVSSAGGALLIEAARVSGLAGALSTVLGRWRRSRARHDPGKVLLDLAIALGLGGDCLADVSVLRAQPALFGAVASDPTVSRLVDTLAADAPATLAAIRSARADARARVWAHRRPVQVDRSIVVDLDATIVISHSEKEQAAPTFKGTFGFHPLLAFLDHGPDGAGEPLAAVLRRGTASANTAADLIAVLDLALRQLPERDRRRVLVRADSGGGTKTFLRHVTRLGLQYSVGVHISDPIEWALDTVPAAAWTPVYNPDGEPRDGAHVAELTGLLAATMTAAGWPPGMRLIARRERPHPGAQLRITDRDGWRLTVFATNTRGGQLPDLEVRHRLRARAEDRIRALKDSGLRNLPLHDFTQNQVWLETVLLAADLLAWTQHLAFPGHSARRWEPKRLRLRLLTVAGRIVRTGRRAILQLPRHWPWADMLIQGHARLAALP